MTSFFGIPPLTLAEWMAGAVGVLGLGLLGLAAFNRILLKMALRNLPRRRAQTVLILFGLMLATLIITASLAVGDTTSYSLQQVQLQQMRGIDEAFSRHPDFSVQGAGTGDADFFSEAQAADVIARSLADPDVQAAQGVIAAPGSMVDLTTQQSSAENIAIFGVQPDFATVWGPLTSRSGGTLDVAALGPHQVLVGSLLAGRLDARTGDVLQLYVDGHPVMVAVAGVLDTEVNPSIANHGPIVGSVLMPLATVRSVMGRPTGYNLVYLHNRGTGGFDDLGPNGATGAAVTRQLRGAVTDSQAAADLYRYLNTPAIKARIKADHDNATFIDPSKDVMARLLAELDQPTVTAEFKALTGDQFVFRIMANAVQESLPSSASPADHRAAMLRLQQLVTALHVDSAAAADLKALLAQPDIRDPLTALASTLPAADPAASAVNDLFAEVQQPAVTPKFKSIVESPDLQKVLGQAIAVVAPSEAARYTEIAGRLDLYWFSPYKADAVLFAQQGSLVTVGALLSVSFFSIAVGVLLIFLIFVMLAAERRAEMGMSRAVGLKRRHLTQMFLFEGTAYTLGAGLIGVAAGVGVGSLMVVILSRVVSSFYSGLTLQYHVEPTSLVIALCLGILLTFAVVGFSAYRVSRLNIVAAIRDLDESEHRDAGLRRLFTDVFGVAWAGLRQLRHGHPLVFLNRITIGALGSIRTFWWALFRRGPLTIALGCLLVFLSFNTHQELVYGAGVSLVIVGAGLLIRWLLTLAHVRTTVASRAGYTASALGLLVYWGKPFGSVEKRLHLETQLHTGQLVGGIEVFPLLTMMVLLGAIWLVMYNSDLLIRGVMFFTGRVASLSAITRTSMAYPMSTKFRTGMTVAMFAIVTFMLVYMSVFKDVLVQNYGQIGPESGGWQIVAGTPDNNFQQTDKTVFPADVASLVRADKTVSGEIQGVGWENAAAAVQLRQVRADGTVAAAGREFRQLHVVDDGYLGSTGYALQPRAQGYSSDRAAWDAVRDNPNDVVLDSGYLDAQNGSPAAITGIKSTDASFKPFQVQLVGDGGGPGIAPRTWTVTVVGFLTRPLWGGAYVSTRTAMQSGLFVDPNAPPSATAALNTHLIKLAPTGYYFSVKPGVSINQARLDLGRMLVQDQLEPISVADQVGVQISGTLTLLNLLTGFLALGLIVGIAGLGVISTRAVVERWQQIGMLRALGYRRSRVQSSFLMESSFIAILGLVIGAVVGLWQSYRFFVTDKMFGNVDFHVPAVEIAVILAGAYAATLLTTFLPARAASRVAPAEALRYE